MKSFQLDTLRYFFDQVHIIYRPSSDIDRSELLGLIEQYPVEVLLPFVCTHAPTSFPSYHALPVTTRAWIDPGLAHVFDFQTFLSVRSSGSSYLNGAIG